MAQLHGGGHRLSGGVILGLQIGYPVGDTLEHRKLLQSEYLLIFKSLQQNHCSRVPSLLHTITFLKVTDYLLNHKDERTQDPIGNNCARPRKGPG